MKRALLAVGLLGACTGPSRFADLDGQRVHYLSYGSGPETIVFVHGWSCYAEVWRLQVPAFEKQARLILIDLPGHGKSDKPEIAYTMDHFARAIDAVMRDAGVDRAVMVGHSNGTPTIRQFYRRYPAKVAALVAVDGTLKAYFTDRKQLDGFVEMFRKPDYKTSIAGFFDTMFRDPALREEVKVRVLETPQHVMAGSLAETGDPELWRPDPIAVPLLLVLAESPMWDDDYLAFVRSLAPQAEIHVLKGAPHFLMMERADEFNALLEAFLKKG